MRSHVGALLPPDLFLILSREEDEGDEEGEEEVRSLDDWLRPLLAFFAALEEDEICCVDVGARSSLDPPAPPLAPPPPPCRPRSPKKRRDMPSDKLLPRLWLPRLCLPPPSPFSWGVPCGPPLAAIFSCSTLPNNN